MLESIYGPEFFREYGRRARAYAQAVEVITAEIHRRFQPRTAIDWGAGACLHAAALARCGVEVLAVDGVRVGDDDRAPEIEPILADLCQPMTRPPHFCRYDLSICIDVLEHLSEEESDTALDNVTDGAACVVLSCAPPGQGGHHHVNEQPRRYWVRKMRARAWCYDRKETGAMERTFLSRRDVLPFSWMYHNLCVYRPLRQAVDSTAT